MVDRERVVQRLGFLGRMIAELERVRACGREAYPAHADARLATERRLQLAEQACIDIATHLLSELNVRMANEYAGLFPTLAEAGVLDRQLAERLAAAARQRNVLVHLYLDVDDEKVWEALEHLDDLRAFAAAIQRLLDREADKPLD